MRNHSTPKRTAFAVGPIRIGGEDVDDRHSVATSMTVDGQVRTIDVTDLRIMCRQFKEGAPARGRGRLSAPMSRAILWCSRPG